MSIAEIWQDLLDKDDRTSPAEYPEMVLITQDELERLLTSAREDAALLAFAMVIRTLTEQARRCDSAASEAVLDVALALGNIGTACARTLAVGKVAGEA